MLRGDGWARFSKNPAAEATERPGTTSPFIGGRNVLTWDGDAAWVGVNDVFSGVLVDCVEDWDELEMVDMWLKPMTSWGVGRVLVVGAGLVCCCCWGCWKIPKLTRDGGGRLLIPVDVLSWCEPTEMRSAAVGFNGVGGSSDDELDPGWGSDCRSGLLTLPLPILSP